MINKKIIDVEYNERNENITYKQWIFVDENDTHIEIKKIYKTKTLTRKLNKKNVIKSIIY